MSHLLSITSSPHFRSTTTTRDIMRDVLIALCPTLLASVFLFGLRALLVSAVCVVSCALFEFLYRRTMKLSNTVYDLSAIVTGLLLAFNLPVNLPLWMAVIGCFVAIVVVKQLFGGLGKNFANPAIVGRIVLLISFATPMTNWVLPNSMRTADAITGATPLATSAAAAATAEAVTSASQVGSAAQESFTFLQMFFGNIGGSLGETCKFTLLLGGIYLVIRKVITVTIPLSYLGTVFLLTLVLGANPVTHLFSGGLMLGAIFMATDYVTTPTTEKGKLFFGIGCGVITVAIRLFASYPEGVSYAILIMNILTPHIDRLTTIKAFGGAKA